MSEEKKEKKPKKEKPPKKEKAPKKEKPPKPPKTKICPECQSEIPKKAKICPHCAAKQKSKFPVILVVVAAVVVILAAGFVSVFIFHFPVDPPFDLPLSASIADTPLAAAMELTKKEEASVTAVFEECGIREITDAKVRSANANSSVYILNDEETSLYLDTKDCIIVQMDNATKTIDSINFQDNPVYRNGQVVAQVTDFYLGTTERDEYLSLTLPAVKDKLDLPETAVFPSKSHWEYIMEDENSGVTVRSTVTTKNATGGEETRTFEAKFEKGKLISITLGSPETAS